MNNANVKAYRIFVYSFIAFFFLFPLFLGFFNYQMDPTHRYRFGVSEPLLKRLAAAHDSVLLIPDNYDNRAFIKKYVRLCQPPSVVVLGGSRVANIQPDIFKKPYNREFLNTSVTAGTIRDYVAIWQMVKQTGFRPKVVFIGIEEQSLNRTSQNDGYLSIYDSYEAFFDRGLSLRVQLMGLTTDVKDLLSLQTTMASVKLLFRDQRKTCQLIPRAEYNGAQSARTPSLSLLYPTNYENKDVESVAVLGNNNGRGELEAFKKWNRADRQGYDQLVALIRDIKKVGGVPVLIGMPYHPEAYRIISENPKAYENMALFVDEIKQIAASEKIFFYDAIIEHGGEFSREEFMDGVHLKTRSNARLFKKADQASGLNLML